MTATLTFNLPEERTEHLQAAQAGRLASILHDTEQHCSNALKYGHPYSSADEAIEEIRGMLLEASPILEP